MNLLRLGLAVLAGLVLGAALFRIPRVKANPQIWGVASVSIYPVSVPDAKSITPVNIPGAKVVGISCTPKAQQGMPDSAVCYLAIAPANPY